MSISPSYRHLLRGVARHASIPVALRPKEIMPLLRPSAIDRAGRAPRRVARGTCAQAFHTLRPNGPHRHHDRAAPDGHLPPRGRIGPRTLENVGAAGLALRPRPFLPYAQSAGVARETEINPNQGTILTSLPLGPKEADVSGHPDTITEILRQRNLRRAPT